ncbi:chemotaxis protein [Bacillus manliponensis]|uniref:Chemotaxis protein n=1 Tax=Bacillus manliponensis TaxID=574376 RepID=A0A073JUL1_9BACI|nr:methyl-accepting chemotaxis protein [Bacillus manliponensis]KEK17866.1 chemotaxis protein [Bacillus manliponensis]
MKQIANWFRGINIGKKLIFSFLSILIMLGLIIGTISYETAKNSIDKQMLINIDENVIVLDNMITTAVEAKAIDVEYFSNLLTEDAYQEANIETAKTNFIHYMNMHPEVEGIFIGTESGLFVREPSINLDEDYNPTERPWYKQAIQNSKEVIITPPYQSTSTKNTVITIAKQTKDGKGVIGLNLKLDSIVKLTSSIKIGEKGYAVILDKDGKVISHPSWKGGEKANYPFLSSIYKKDADTISFIEKGADKKLAYATNKTTGWKIIGVMYNDELTEAAMDVLYKTLAVIFIAVLIGSTLVYFITLSITRPLQNIVTSTQKISEGDLTEEISVRSNDEIGRLGLNFNEMASSLRNVISKMNGSAERLAASSEELTASVKQANDATEEITVAMDQVASGASLQSKGVEEGASLLQEVNGAIEYVTQGTETISNSSRYARTKAEEGETFVNQTVTQMESIQQSVSESDHIIRLLDEKSKRIGAILEVIQNISGQTNLLALNAAIEAARAGEQGRGFAIVADEVRKLAEQTGESSNEIDQLIAEIKKDIGQTVYSMESVKHEVKSGIEIVNKTKTSFTDILHVTNDIASQVTNMVATTKQMKDHANEVTNTIDNIAAAAEENTASMQNVAASSEEQMHSMEEISESAQQLSQMAEELQNMIEQFKI